MLPKLSMHSMKSVDESGLISPKHYYTGVAPNLIPSSMITHEPISLLSASLLLI